jgi:hypothetical protein
MNEGMIDDGGQRGGCKPVEDVVQGMVRWSTEALHSEYELYEQSGSTLW